MRVFKVPAGTNPATYNADTLDKTCNWFIYGGKGKAKLVFHKFKLAPDFGGRQTIDATAELGAAIKKWIARHKIGQSEWMLGNQGTGPLGNALGGVLTSATSEMLGGAQGFSVNGYRHAFASFALSKAHPQNKVDAFANAVGETKGETFRSYFRVGLNEKTQ